MNLITFQSIEALEFLNNNGYLICDDSHAPSDKYSSSYKFIIDNMNKNLNNNDNVKYPIWCWVKCYDGIWPPTVKGKKVEWFDVKIAFNKKKEDIFITDCRWYSFLLKNMYIPDGIEDKEKFDNKLKELKVLDKLLLTFTTLNNICHWKNWQKPKKIIYLCGLYTFLNKKSEDRRLIKC